MKNLLKKFNKSTMKHSFYDIELFSEKNLEIYDTPYIELSFNLSDNNTSIDSDNQSGGVNDIDIINDLVKSIKKYKHIYSNVLAHYNSFKFDFKDIITKKDLLYIKKKYNITFNDSIYVYSDRGSSNVFGFMEYKFMDYHINKKIEIIGDFCMIFFLLSTDVWVKHNDVLTKYIIKIIDKLSINGSIIFKFIFYPPDNNLLNLYFTFIDCFESVNIMYSKWDSQRQNLVYYILKNKKKNTSDPVINNFTDDIKKRMFKYTIDIFNFMLFDTKINGNLQNIKIKQYNMYLPLANKILEKLTIHK